MQYFIKNAHAEFGADNKRGFAVSGQTKVKAAKERHLATVHKNLTDGCLPCQNGMAKDPQTCRGRQDTGAPPPKPTPSLPGLPPVPPAPPGVNEGAAMSENEGVPPGYVYIHPPLPNAQFISQEAFAKNRKCDKDFIPVVLTDEATTTGWYTLCCTVMVLTSILQTRAA